VPKVAILRFFLNSKRVLFGDTCDPRCFLMRFDRSFPRTWTRLTHVIPDIGQLKTEYLSLLPNWPLYHSSPATTAKTNHQAAPYRAPRARDSALCPHSDDQFKSLNTVAPPLPRLDSVESRHGIPHQTGRVSGKHGSKVNPAVFRHFLKSEERRVLFGRAC